MNGDADDIKAAFPALNLNLAKREKLAQAVRAREWQKARELKEQLDGPLPRGQVIPLRHKPQR